MSSLQAVRDAVKSTIESTIGSLFVYDTVPEASNLPALVVVPFTASFDKAFGRGTDQYEFDLAVMVSFTESDIGQDALDDYITGAGAKSVRQAIFQNQSLGLPNTNAHVSEMTDYGATFEMASVQHIGAKLRLIVYTKGTE